VLSRYVDAIMIRTTDHARLLELTENATVPVINGLTDDAPLPDHGRRHDLRGASRPDQGQDHRLDGRRQQRAAFADRGAARFGFKLNIAVPEGSEPERTSTGRARNGGAVRLTRIPRRPSTGADCVVTDTWVSMGEEHRARGHNVFLPYQVNAALMGAAKPTRCSCTACRPIAARR
jgi:ornithine carbamoyltransferase